MSINFLKGRYAILSVLALAGAVCFTSCGDDDEEEDIIKELTLNAGQTGYYKLSGATPVYEVDNEFVAVIDPNGNITARHIGVTNVYMEYDEQTYICVVTVEPLYFTYTEPVLDFGATQSEIKSAETRELISEDEETLVFQGTESFEPEIRYYFDGGKCEGAAVCMAADDLTDDLTNRIDGFLTERYALVAKKDNYDVLGNADSEDDCTVFVMVSYVDDTVFIAYSNESE